MKQKPIVMGVVAILLLGVIACNLPGVAGPPTEQACTIAPDPLVTVTQADWREVFGCPTGEARSVQLEWLPFENGAMLLDVSQGVIYAFFDDGTVETLDNTFVPGEADQDPSLQPPDSLYQPSGPIGKAWRESQSARDKLGWSTMPDSRKYDGLKQEMLDEGTIVFAMGNGDLVGLFPFSDNWSRLPVDTIPNYYGGIPGTPGTGVAVFSTFGLLVAAGLIITRRRTEG